MRRFSIGRLQLSVASWLVIAVMATEAEAAPENVDFVREVRPILSEHCFECHGPDENTREAGLRLDLEKGAFGEADSGEIPILPGKPDQSELVRRITSDDEDARMPPAEHGKPLSAEQIDTLRRWIAEGATWQAHWSFIPPVRPHLPEVKELQWANNEIDYFILARLEQEGLQPSRRAERETLIRRATLDLTGLPPTLAEVDAFANDRSPHAYQKVVDRLLASPRFGEQWAWTWLDAARYSDTNGYQGDLTRTMWPWRNWVIDALNANMPFDQFTVEQLAGDLIENATVDQQIASGFHRNHPLNGEGGRIPEESRVEYVVDRVATTSTVWMALTADCSRCHDHKFDPLTQKEFYQLYAYFNNIDETGAVDLGGNAKPVIKAPVKSKFYEIAKAKEQLEDLESELASIAALDQEKFRAWEEKMRTASDRSPTTSGWKFMGPFDAAGLRQGHNRIFGPENTGDTSQTVGDKQWEDQDWPDRQNVPLPLPASTVGFLYREIHADAPLTLALNLRADDAIRVWLNGAEVAETITATSPRPDQVQIKIELSTGKNDFLMKISNGGGISGFYYAANNEGLAQDVRDILARPGAERTEEQNLRLTRLYLRSLPQLRDKVYRISRLEGRIKQLEKDAYVQTMVMRELPNPRETYVLQRGLYDQPDKSEKLVPSLPAALTRPGQQPPKNRLGLAQWLIDPNHPLTARVAVNRYWQILFGAGLVATTEDFGSQGRLPTHPELLDWLATKYVDSDWDTKALLRMIVTSQTYLQSSTTQPEMLEADPENRWLGRGSRFRLPSHTLRDQALSLAGLLVEKVGGPSVKPYQPPGIWQDFSFGKIRYTQDKGPKLYRRTLYTFWRRSVAPTNIFDNSDRQACSVRLRRTNTPLHALILLNDKTFVEAARAMAERMLRDTQQSPSQRLATAFRMATSRRPTAEEEEILAATLQRALDYYRQHEADAKELLGVGESKSTMANIMDVAAYATVMNLILNLDEAMTRE